MAIEFEGLTKDEANLIRVAKFFNDNAEQFEAVVCKLVNGMKLPTSAVSHMTGLSTHKVGAIARKKKPTFNKANYEYPDTAFEEVDVEEDSDAGAESMFSTTTIVGRLANELHEEIRKVYNSDEVFLSQREVVDKFNCTRASAERAFNLLKEKGILVPDGPKKPLRVK